MEKLNDLFQNKQEYRTRLAKCIEQCKEIGYKVDILEDSMSIFIFLYRDGIMCSNFYLPYDRHKPSAEKEIAHFEEFVTYQYLKYISLLPVEKSPVVEMKKVREEFDKVIHDHLCKTFQIICNTFPQLKDFTLSGSVPTHGERKQLKSLCFSSGVIMVTFYNIDRDIIEVDSITNIDTSLLLSILNQVNTTIQKDQLFTDWL